MRRVGVTGAGAADVLVIEEAPTPRPRPGEVLIAVQAAGINRPDIQQRRGLYPPPADASPVLGLEVAGEVVALGEGVGGEDVGADGGGGEGVAGPAVGDRVCALANGGGYAEYCCVPAVQCLPWPAGYDAVRAAALPETFFTVWANLFMLGRLRAGERVLIHGGSSGIGTTAIQLAREFGAEVLTTVGSAAKARACEGLGAAHAINYHEQDFVVEVDRLTGGRGVDVVLDIVGGSYLHRNLSVLAMDGREVLVAVQGGTRDPDFDMRVVMMKRLTVTGSTMRPRSTAQKGAIADALRAHVWPALDAGRCAPVIHGVFAMADVADAHRLMESSAHIGKIVLRMT
jgi:NADPH2:quinone reductase